MDRLSADMRLALRSPLRNPGFTFVAVLTLALGTGANSAVFSVLETLVFPPTAVERPAGLMLLSEQRISGDRIFPDVSYPGYEDWKAGARTLDEIAYSTWLVPFTSSGGHHAERLNGALVTSLRSACGCSAPIPPSWAAR